MNESIELLMQELRNYQTRCGQDSSDSILELLWYCYLESNPVDDGQIKQAEAAIAPVFEELSLKSSDLLMDSICDICTAYQRAAFLEGLQTGFHLSDELSRNKRCTL